MKKLFTQMLAIVSLLLVSTVGSWAATVDTPTLPELPTGVLDVQALTTLDANGWAVYNAQAIHSSTKPNWYKNNGASTTTWTPTAAVEIGVPFTNVAANSGTSVVTLRSNRTVAYRIKNASSASIVYARYSGHKVTLDARVITSGTVATTGVTDAKTESKDANKTAILTVALDSSKEYVIYAYSDNDGGNTYFYQFAFKAAEDGALPQLNGAWSKTSDEVLLDAEAPALPTFGVTATSGSPVKGTDYSVAYSLKTGSTEGILTVDAANGITAINTNVEGTATAVATVENLNTTGYTLSTTKYEYTITVRAQPKSTVCTLSELMVNGVAIEGFDPETNVYDYIVDDDVIDLPTVTYTVTDDKSTAALTNAGSIWGQTKVKVTAEDNSKTKTYTITFKYKETVDTPTYAIANGDPIVGGETTIVKDGVTLVFGAKDTANEWKSGKDNGYLPAFTAFTEGNGVNPSPAGSGKIPATGTFYKFSATKNGSLKVGVICNSSRDLYVIDSEGNEVYHIKPTTKVYKTIDFDVITGKDYYLYAVSTKLGLYGFYFTEAVTLNNKGFATFSCAYPVKISGAKVYGAKLDLTNNKIIATEIESGEVPAGNGVIITGEAGASVSASYKASVSAIAGNDLKATTNADGSLAAKDGDALVLSGNTFKNFTGDAFAANKAYFPYTKPNTEAKSFTIVFDDNNGTVTSINTIESANEAVVKTVKNGKLIIIKGGKAYNAVGAEIK